MRKWERKVEKNSRKFPSKIVFTKYQKHHILWEVFQPLFIVPKQTLMSFIYYKRRKRKNYNFGDFSRRSMRTKWYSHTLPKFGTPYQILAHLAKFWHTLWNWWFCLAKCSVFLHLTTDSFSNPFPSLSRVLKCSKAQILHVLQTLPQSWPISVIKKLPKTLKLTRNGLVTFVRSFTCQLG